MSEFFGVSRAAYYQWIKRGSQPDRDQARMELVQEASEKSHKVYGYRRIVLWIRKHKGVSMNHKAVLRLMNKLHIHSVVRRRKIFIPRAQLDTYHRYQYVLQRDFQASQPNQ